MGDINLSIDRIKMKTTILNFLICGLLFYQCAKKDKDSIPEPSVQIVLPEKPLPNTEIPDKNITNNKSFNLTIDLFNKNETIQFNNSLSVGNSHLWVFGDRLTSKEENPTVSFSEAGVIPVKHIVTLNDSLQNVFIDTIYVGQIYLNGYSIDSIGYSSVTIAMTTSSTYVGSTSSAQGYIAGVYPIVLKANSIIYSYTTTRFRVYDTTLGYVEDETIDVKTINKVALNDYSGKFPIVSSSGTMIWALFYLK